jgi:DNA primase
MSIDARLIESAHATPIERVIDQHGIKLRGKIERCGPCPICGGTDRFSINTKKQVFNCRGCGVGGDAIALVQFLNGCSFQSAISTLTGENPRSKRNAPEDISLSPRDHDHDDRQRDKALRLWRVSELPMAAPVEAYLRSRGIASFLPATVRFLPPLKPEHHPAMIVAYGMANEREPGSLDIAENKITAVQLTLIKPDGSGKVDVKPNKLTIGSPADQPMVIAPVNDLLGLAICEGVEDALSAQRATGLGAWASGGASFMPKLARTVPHYVETVTIYAHEDDAGQRGARHLADALAARGVDVFINGLAP